MPFQSQISKDDLCGSPCKRIQEVIDFLGSDCTMTLCDELRELAILTFPQGPQIVGQGIMSFQDYAQDPTTFTDGTPVRARIANSTGDPYADIDVGYAGNNLQFSGGVHRGFKMTGRLTVRCGRCYSSPYVHSLVQELSQSQPQSLCAT